MKQPEMFRIIAVKLRGQNQLVASDFPFDLATHIPAISEALLKHADSLEAGEKKVSKK